jgi:ketosteroid isomerase-like protein
MKQGGKPIPSRGAWLFLFQREKGGAWKILEQTWTSFGAPPKL